MLFLPSAVRSNELVHETKTDYSDSRIVKISAIVVFLLEKDFKRYGKKKVVSTISIQLEKVGVNSLFICGTEFRMPLLSWVSCTYNLF